MNSKEYKQSLNKKVKDMTPEEKKKYGKLRTQESRAKKKGTHTMPDGTKMTGETHTKDSKPVKKEKKVIKIKKTGGVNAKTGANKGNIANKKLKCFMLTAKNGGKYRTCVVPEKDKKPKKTVRDAPRKEPRKRAYIKAYSSVAERTADQKARAKAKREEKKKEKEPKTVVAKNKKKFKIKVKK